MRKRTSRYKRSRIRKRIVSRNRSRISSSTLTLSSVRALTLATKHVPSTPPNDARRDIVTTTTTTNINASASVVMSSSSRKTPLPASSSNDGGRGRLVATVLSTYDLPEGARPTSVRLTVDGRPTVSTGPPRSRHKDKNAYRFVANDGDGATSDGGHGHNELVVQAPLSCLYGATASFSVEFEGGYSGSLTCEVDLASALLVNETKWLILNLAEDGDDDDDGDSSPPTLRLKLLLEGDYRHEVRLSLALVASYFRAVDGLTDAASSSLGALAAALPLRTPPSKLLLVPAVPAAAACVALSPVVLGALVVGLPFFLPFLVLAGFVSASLGVVALVLRSSTRDGRARAAEVVGPAGSALLATSVGQRLVYDVGPRPTPVQTARALLPASDDVVATLLVSLAVDAVGSSSFLLPVVGEAFDLVWAPLQTVLVAAMYDHDSPALKYVSFLEEILPFTDVVPTATMGWCRRFAPTLLERTGHDLAVVLRREKAGLRTVTG